MKRFLYSLASTFLCAVATAQQIPSSQEVAAAKKAPPKSNTGDNKTQKNIFMPPEDMLPDSYAASYNAPAGVSVKNDDNWMPNAFIDLSFLYYYGTEDGLDLANSAMLVSSSGSFITAATTNSVALQQDFDYKPAFKIGLGSNFREWKLSGEYTWVRQSTYTNSNAQAPIPSGVAVWVLNNWFEQTTPSANQALSATKITSKWKLAMDLADVVAGRPYYEGKNLILSSFYGLRGAWIRQTVNVGASVSSLIFSDPSASVIYSRNHSNSWGVGPRAGFEASCLLGMGFRFEGDAAASVLYTKYTSIEHSEQAASLAAVPSKLGLTMNQYVTVRPELDMSIGFGWGTYLDGQTYHIDFSAKYDFAVFWQQNMIRKLLDQAVAGTGAAAGNLYLQGLNVRGSFDF